MAQKQNIKKALLCTHKDCKKLQTADGEFCEKHYPKKVFTKDKLIDALNRIDELACEGAGGLTEAEVELEKDYNYLFDFILTFKK
jgi:hypothetical protein